MSKRGLSFLDAVGAAEERLKNGDKPSQDPDSRMAGGFVGRSLAASNASLDERVSEAERQAREAREQLAPLIARAEAAEAKLATGSGVIFVDPTRVRRSRFADRHPKAYEDAAFAELCELLLEAGGNTEAGQVRPVTDDPAYDYELASAHRRHAGCLKNNLPFKVEVHDMTDAQLLRQMYRENTGKLNLSNFERGRHYAKLVRDKEFSSVRALAAELRIPQTTVQRLLRYGDLPAPIVEAFADPREIRFEWIEPLVTAFAADAAAIERAIAGIDPATDNKPLRVFQKLLGLTASKRVISDGDQVLGRIRTINGCPAIVLRKDAPDALLDELRKVVATWADREEQRQ
ncbi:MAG: hypothetical protein ACREPQ_14435 [Rhodanobacter sp.]